jgi:phosphoesterase RecJ-like protein
MKDIDGVVETIRDIKGVQVACLIKEVGTDKTKVSLRSKGQVNVSEISSEFGGGGHPRAAGFNLECNLAMSIETVLKAFQNLFGE